MSTTTNTVTTGAARGVPGRPARTDRPVRDPDPVRNAAYWARIDAIVDQAPPLTDHQKAVIRSAFHQPTIKEAA